MQKPSNIFSEYHSYIWYVCENEAVEFYQIFHLEYTHFPSSPTPKKCTIGGMVMIFIYAS